MFIKLIGRIIIKYLMVGTRSFEFVENEKQSKRSELYFSKFIEDMQRDRISVRQELLVK